MRTTIKLLCLTLAIYFSPVMAGSETPSFEDCPATASVLTPKNPPNLKLSNAKSRRFASQLRTAAKQAVNFAGHYIFASWGCGAGCVMGGVIDAQTGAVAMLPFSVSDWPLDVTEPLSFRENSCLLIVRGSRNERSSGTYYYKFKGSRFELLKATSE